MNIVVCIPARYASTRFPGKVLAKETGKYLIQHTYEQASKAALADQVIIAADDERIVAAAAEFGGRCVLTRPDHQSGTDRIAEVVADLDVDIVINVQGDEPEIDPAHIDYLARLLTEDPEAPMATLAARFTSKEQIADPNVVKVIVTNVGRASPLASRAGTHDLPARAIYFSRSPIPYDRDNGGVGDPSHYLRHLGIYAYRKDLLLAITQLPQTPLEKLEKLEQLRVIEHGYPILVGTVEHPCEGIDTPEQYAAFVERWRTIHSVVTNMQVLTTVDKWFDETFSYFETKAKPMKQSDRLLLGALNCARKHCKGILVLLLPDHRHKLPAAALLRVFCEICIRLEWCIQAPDKTDSPDKDNCWQRLRRWDYHSRLEHKKMCKKLCDATTGSQADSSIDRALQEANHNIEEYKKDNLRCMPDMAGIIRELAKVHPEWTGVYPQWFQNFSRAVHLDMGLIDSMVQACDDRIICFADPPEYGNLDLLHYCLCLGCDINHTVRRYYGWDAAKMQGEYEALVKKIDEMRKDEQTNS